MSRPKGSKNKNKKSDRLSIKKDNSLLVNLFGNKKEIKKEIRKLHKLKLKCRAGTPERIKLHRQIKDLKGKLTETNIISPEKEKLIQEIKELEPDFLTELVNLRQYTNEQLQKHIDTVKRKRRR